ncbi:MAG: hypothetical protein Salg2KO_00640 [Salibacteraceae bacterium]
MASTIRFGFILVLSIVLSKTLLSQYNSDQVLELIETTYKKSLNETPQLYTDKSKRAIESMMLRLFAKPEIIGADPNKTQLVFTIDFMLTPTEIKETDTSMLQVERSERFEGKMFISPPHNGFSNGYDTTRNVLIHIQEKKYRYPRSKGQDKQEALDAFKQDFYNQHRIVVDWTKSPTRVYFSLPYREDFEPKFRPKRR